LVYRVNLSGLASAENRKISQVPGEPPLYMPRSQTPEEGASLALSIRHLLPSRELTLSASSLCIISRLNSTACTLPVYASLGGHPLPRNTRFRLPAQLWRVGYDYPLGSTERFP
jgi:hypothetical protein